MYLSRLMLNPRHRTVHRDLSDCQALHRRILDAFPDAGGADARARFGVLHRVEVQPRTGVPAVLVQSAVAPDWRALPDGYLLPDRGEPHNPAVKPVDEQYAALRAGVVLRFRLRANPTKRVSARDTTEPNPARWAGKRVELRSEEAQLEWLRRKGEAGGFRLERVQAAPAAGDVDDVRRDPGTAAHGWRRPAGEGRAERLTFGSVLFEGLLRVTDAEAFRQTLAAGLGSGKAYGFGLLSVAPVG